ncbi:MAG: CU044_2847 family protein [Cyanobacteria bacterium J06632_22]
MSKIKPFQLEDADGTTYTVMIAVPDDADDAPAADADDDLESYGLSEMIGAPLNQAHGMIRAYTNYVIGAFKNMAGANVSEIKLKFGLMVGGNAGIPIFTEGKAEGNFEVEVTCTFPPQQS